ncbi:protocadherin gamma-C3-like [Phycodurus eques]|uniref:protocadherin gamma-C3-like n=1 Tax=Phycodurus eques TaxID=693459 RepID=UPI002ACEC97F|nr:protocadherin gamma-C3-like [Phycodurus eques]
MRTEFRSLLAALTMRTRQQRRDFWMFFALLVCVSGSPATQLSFSMNEEANKGFVLGNIAKDFNLNVHELHTRGLRVVSSYSKEYFNVNLQSGNLFVNERVDREELCPNVVKCALRIQAVLNNPMTAHRIEIHILDINDNAPAFVENAYTLDISESALPGERHFLPVAVDADVGSNSVRSYKLSNNEHFTLDVQGGGDHDVSAELVLQKPLDREKQSLITLTLTALDGGKPPKSGSLQILVNVRDVNDNVPTFSKSLYKARLREDAAQGSHHVLNNKFVTGRDGSAPLLLGNGLLAEIRYSTPEEVKMELLLGILAKDLGLDVGSLVDRRFRVVAESKEAFFEETSRRGAVREQADRQR